MIIEFCGVPGSGKSTIAAALARELRSSGAAATLALEPVSARLPPQRRLPRKLAWAAGEICRHPRLSTRTFVLVGRSGQPSRRDVATRSLNWLVLRSALRSDVDPAVIRIVDQGLVQELGSIGFRGDSRRSFELADPGSDRLAPDMIVFVEVDTSTAVERLLARPGRESRIEGTKVDLPMELERQARLLRDLVEAWIERYGSVRPTELRRVSNNVDEVDGRHLMVALGLAHDTRNRAE